MFRIALISLYDMGTHGHRCLSSALKHHGFEVHNIYFGDQVIQDVPLTSEKELLSFDHLVQQLRPNLVGLSVTSLFSHPLAANLSSRIKSFSDTPIIFGGPHPTIVPRFCLEEAKIDYVCIGEGEESVVELCKGLSSGKKTDDIPGIMTKETLRYLQRNPPQVLDQLPFQDIENENKYLILSDGSVIEGEPALRTTSYNTKCSRGCPFRCGYCSAAYLRSLCESGKFYRKRSVQNVIAELRRYLEINPNCRAIGFWDDNFPFDLSWVEEFSSQYKKLIHLPFHIWAHPNTINDRLMGALKSAGLKSVISGVESASDRTRKEIFLRPESREDILKADRVLSKQGIEKTYDFITDHPWENQTELEDTFELLTKLKRPFKINMHNLFLFPNTELAKRTIKEGRMTEKGMIENIISNVQSTSRTFQWIRGIPRQRNLERAYWIFLIMCIGNSKIPLWFIKFLSRLKILRKYPILLTDSEVMDMQGREGVSGACLTFPFQNSNFMQRLFNTSYKKMPLLTFMGYLGCRFLSRLLKGNLQRSNKN